jgi:hypothetical protein
MVNVKTIKLFIVLTTTNEVLPNLFGPFEFSIWLMKRDPVGALFNGTTNEVISGTSSITTLATRIQGGRTWYHVP